MDNWEAWQIWSVVAGGIVVAYGVGALIVWALWEAFKQATREAGDAWREGTKGKDEP